MKNTLQGRARGKQRSARPETKGLMPNSSPTPSTRLQRPVVRLPQNTAPPHIQKTDGCLASSQRRQCPKGFWQCQLHPPEKAAAPSMRQSPPLLGCIKLSLLLAWCGFRSSNRLPSELSCIVSNEQHVSVLWSSWRFSRNIQSSGTGAWPGAPVLHQTSRKLQEMKWGEPCQQAEKK